MDEELERWLKHHEGLKLHPYKCPADKWTIGYGRNLEDNGITEEEALFLLRNDIERCKKELAPFPWYVNQPKQVQDALINMCFNLGLSRLLGFRKMIMALTVKNYTEAAKEALDSKWAEQVGFRAKDIALMLRQGWQA